MSDLYTSTPGSYGSFSSPFPGGSSSKGYYQQPLNLPFYSGKSILATIPEYQRNPLMLEKDLLFKIMEGRASMMKILLEYAESNGFHETMDVRYRIPIDVKPTQRIYLDTQSAIGTVTSNGYHTFKIKSNQSKIATSMSGGNPKQVGDIARLEKDQFILMMFSWVEPRRTATVSGSACVKYSPSAIDSAPLPEIAKIVAIDYAKSTITVQRNWAGEQRSSFTYSNTTIPPFSVAASETWGSDVIPSKFAFILPMAKSMKEDEIDAKVKHYTKTWTYGILQRHLLAWGSQYFSEVISNNMGIESPLMSSRQDAIEEYYNHWEWTSLFGEKDEEHDSETGYWSGNTDGLLANIPKSHYISLKGIDFTATLTAGSSGNFGSFHPIVFNKIMENMAYMGSQEKVLVCGSSFHTQFTTMINFMTQAVPDIKTSWNVEGKEFKTSQGLKITVIPSDKMSLNGLSNTAVLFDKAAFKAVKLKNYPSADIHEVQNENPLIKNGFIHGVKGFIDMNPDAHWVFTTTDKYRADGSTNATEYASAAVLGTPLE